jgi:hypothetical protein
MIRPAASAAPCGSNPDRPRAIVSALTNSVTSRVSRSSNGATVDLPAPLGPATATTAGRSSTVKATHGHAKGLQVRPHDPGHPADLSVPPQLVHGGPALTPSFPQGLERHVEADLVPIFEAVGHRLGRVEDADGHAVYPVGVNARCERSIAHPEDADRGMLKPRSSSPPRERDLDLVRNLGGDAVEGQGGDEADDCLGHTRGDDDQAGLAGLGQVSQAIDSPTDGHQPPRVAEPVERARMDPERQRP